MKSPWRAALYFVAAIVITALTSAAVTMRVYNAKRENEVALSAEEYKELGDILALDKVMDDIDAEYYYETPDREQLINAAAKAMVNSLDDPYSMYYTDEEYQTYLKSINGAYDGIGVLIAQPDEIGATILDVYENTAAHDAGLSPGDIIVAVDDVPTAGLSLEEINTLVAKNKGETVTLSVLKAAVATSGENEESGEEPEQTPTPSPGAKGEAETIKVTLECGTVNIKRVEHFLYNHHTGYIRISMFTGNCAEEFREAIKDLTDRGMTSLVIDLRNNPGGSLKDVVSIADDILGECTIVSIKGKNDDEAEIYTSNKRGITVPLAVIVNEDSASASEILAAAVQETETGIVVGTPTFGKGVVQTTRRIEANGAWLKLTTAAYFTPNGNSIHGKGVVPDIEVDIPEEMKHTPIDMLDQEQDLQLWAALDYVRELAGELD